MHDYFLRALVDQHRRHLMAEADAHRQIKAADAVRYESSAPAVPGLIWAEGTQLTVRPIACDDSDRLTRLFGRLSPRSIQLRFLSPIRRLSRAQLARLVDVDHECREALVALSNDEIIAVARYDGVCGSGEAEIAVTVEDAWQHRGIGKRLTRRLSKLAIARGYDTFVADILPDNRAALSMVRKLSPDASIRWSRGEYRASIPLLRSRASGI
jgi:ribosomal protein S18 acetylase RimI-like enzyme